MCSDSSTTNLCHCFFVLCSKWESMPWLWPDSQNPCDLCVQLYKLLFVLISEIIISRGVICIILWSWPTDPPKLHTWSCIIQHLEKLMNSLRVQLSLCSDPFPVWSAHLISLCSLIVNLSALCLVTPLGWIISLRSAPDYLSLAPAHILDLLKLINYMLKLSIIVFSNGTVPWYYNQLVCPISHITTTAHIYILNFHELLCVISLTLISFGDGDHLFCLIPCVNWTLNLEMVHWMVMKFCSFLIR